MRPVLHLACSSGGHIDLLMRLAPALEEQFEVVWVTQPSRRAADLQRDGARMILLPEYSRNPIEGRTLAAIARSAAACVGTDRPRLVVTSGSGLVVPFCVFARAAGARVIFIETSARVSTPSQAGRVLHRVAARTIVQWQPMLGVYPGATRALPSVVQDVVARPAEPGSGTFVGLGTHIYAFDRLLAMVDTALDEGLLAGPVVAQTGVSTYRPRNFEARPWMEPDEIGAAIKSSRYVVTHAGSGTISTALRSGRRPLVLARRAHLREHFDDHQSQIVGELRRLGLIVALGERITAADLTAVDVPLPDPRDQIDEPTLAQVLREELAGLVRTQSRGHRAGTIG